MPVELKHATAHLLEGVTPCFRLLFARIRARPCAAGRLFLRCAMRCPHVRSARKAEAGRMLRSLFHECA